VTLSRRFAIVAAAAVALAIAIASAIVYVVVDDQLHDEVDGSLRDLAARAAVGPAPAPGPGRRVVPLREPPRPAGRSGPESGLRLALPAPFGVPAGIGQVVGADGRVFRARDQAALPVSPAVRQVASGARPAFFSDVEVGGQKLRVLTTQVVPGNALEVARSLGEVDRTLRDLALILVLVTAGGVALAAVLGGLAARAAVRPVSRLTDVVEEVARTRDLARRIPAAGTDELARLARAFNALLAALDSSIAAQRRLVADASHELRTPLTSLRTNVEVLARPDGPVTEDRRRLIHDVIDQLDELGKLVSNLVDSARGLDGGDAAILRLDELVADCVARAARDHREIRFATTLEPCRTRGVADALRRAVDNLLENAAKWSSRGGEVEVTLSSRGELAVRDHGEGIDAADLPQVFERFYRAPSARPVPGSGLGLAIVQQVAEAHRGGVSIAPAPGGGTLAELALPVEEVSADSSPALSPLSA
jgi:two-component system, OmpR family, sensor histidine kinase MprB